MLNLGVLPLRVSSPQPSTASPASAYRGAARKFRPPSGMAGCMLRGSGHTATARRRRYYRLSHSERDGLSSAELKFGVTALFVCTASAIVSLVSCHAARLASQTEQACQPVQWKASALAKGNLTESWHEKSPATHWNYGGLENGASDRI